MILITTLIQKAAIICFILIILATIIALGLAGLTLYSTIIDMIKNHRNEKENHETVR